MREDLPYIFEGSSQDVGEVMPVPAGISQGCMSNLVFTKK
jgi:hypothetical protein